MLNINLFRKLPIAAKEWLFYRGLPFMFFIRFFISRLYGIFILSLTLYFFFWFFGDTKPFTFGQLLLWFSDLPESTKTAVVSSLITIIGFLFAFHAATINWKAQALAQLRIKVADQIESFFNEAARHTISAQIYVQSLIDIVENKQNQTKFMIEYLQGGSQEFFSSRNRLSAMSVDIYRLSGSNHSILSAYWGALDLFDDCTKAFSEITEKMWVHVPSTGGYDSIAEFINQIDVAACRDFVECCERNGVILNGIAGGLRGLLLATVAEFNLSSVQSLSGKEKRDGFVMAMAKIFHLGKK